MTGDSGVNYMSQDAIHWSLFEIRDDKLSRNGIHSIYRVCGGYIGDVYYYVMMYRRTQCDDGRLAITTDMKEWKTYSFGTRDTGDGRVMCCGDGKLECVYESEKMTMILDLKDVDTESVMTRLILCRSHPWTDMTFAESVTGSEDGTETRRGVFARVSDDGIIAYSTTDYVINRSITSPFMMMKRIVCVKSEPLTFMITREDSEGGDNKVLMFTPREFMTDGVNETREVTVPFDMKNSVVCVGDGKVVIASAMTSINDDVTGALKITKLYGCNGLAQDVGKMVDDGGVLVDNEEMAERLFRSNRLYVVTAVMGEGYAIVKRVNTIVKKEEKKTVDVEDVMRLIGA